MAQISDDDMNLPLPAIAENLKTAASSLPEVAKLKPEEIVDSSLIQEIKASGFREQLAKS